MICSISIRSKPSNPNSLPVDAKILHSLARYCAYQERCVQELHKKMYELGLLSDDFVEYIGWLTENNFVHEGRFAEIYVRSKFNQKHWGRQKINFELRKRGITEAFIEKAWELIQESTYSEQLALLIRKKKASLKTGSGAQQYQKCVYSPNPKVLKSIWSTSKSKRSSRRMQRIPKKRLLWNERNIKSFRRSRKARWPVHVSDGFDFQP